MMICTCKKGLPMYNIVILIESDFNKCHNQCYFKTFLEKRQNKLAKRNEYNTVKIW